MKSDHYIRQLDEAEGKTCMRTGKPSKRFSNFGVWAHSYGPNSALPGSRLQLVIYDKNDNIVRRFEQIEQVTDDGYVDFFNSHRCRPVQSTHPLVDIAPDGTQTVIIADFNQGMDQQIYLDELGKWAKKYGSRDEN